MSRLAILFGCVCLLSGARAAAAPPLTATFETVARGHARQRWTLARDQGRVAYVFGDAAERRFDLWLRRTKELRLVRVFQKEKTAVEYTEGQLRALGTARSWQQLETLLPAHPAQLGLKQVGTGTFLQRPVLRFEGVLNGERVVVSWLEAEQLPAQLTRRDHSITLQKLVLGRAKLGPEVEHKHYRRIDAADLGDLEHDPFVKRHGSVLHP